MSQQFCLKWNNHMNNMMDVFKNLLSTEAMVDVTLACDGLSLKAHKIVLSACSPFFQALFLENPCKHPIVILKDMKYSELKAIIEFMYHGEVNVAQDQLSALMKTAETLRVKGLAEVTNEKNSQSSNVPQDDTGHRSVPRTDTPPPKRRRGRTRKRSLSDSNRSDDDSEPKIKQPDSPEIEELSGDVTIDNNSGQYSNLQSQVPMQTLSSHSTNSYHKSSISQDSQVVEDAASADESFASEEKFGVEPSKLLEQTLTTDDLPNRRTGRSSVPSSMEVQRRPRSSTEHSTSLVPTSMPSEALGSNQQPESPPDIKPELLELDPAMSPVAGPSHSTDNSMMLYMDQSTVSTLPGPSGYQDNSSLVSQDSQPQGAEKGYECDVCKCLFAYKDALERHRKSHPRSDGKFRCSLCEYSSKREDNVKRHMLTHTKEKPHACPHCHSRFRLKGHLQLHLRTHTGEKPYICTHCEKAFSTWGVLQAHQRTHTGERPFLCRTCGKSFSSRSNILDHERVHTGERPYECPYCDYKAKQSNSITKHVVTHHTKLYPHFCDKCQKGFYHHSYLKRHVAKEHS